MRFGLLVGGLLGGLCARASAQQPLQSVSGFVRDSSGAGLGGADVTIGQRRTTTGPQGSFRIDSLRPGQYSITIRLVGFSPVRSRVAVVASEPTELEYFLTQEPLRLPTMVVAARRTGLFGAVGDTGFRAIVGARVQVGGTNGGEVRTDSTGRFAFPLAHGGQYMVRVTFPGYGERRFLVELKRGEGRELGVLLAPYPGVASRADDIAVEELGKRLAAGLRQERLTSLQLERYESLPLCDLPRIKAEIGTNRNASILLSVNGVTADTSADLARLCAWRADEVELVEFGPDTCRDVTLTIPDLVGIYCAFRSRRSPRSMMGSGGRVRTQGVGMRYVIIWEKR
jgi:carboxypeptidase family protein